jgi:hypothetical protein
MKEQAMSQESVMLRKRDAKAKPHLDQYAPVWLVDQQPIPADEAVLFDVVFQHNLYGWVQRRYRFDAFNNVLYYKGQTILSDDDVQRIQAHEPYISMAVTDLPNAYGG